MRYAFILMGSLALLYAAEVSTRTMTQPGPSGDPKYLFHVIMIALVAFAGAYVVRSRQTARRV